MFFTDDTSDNKFILDSKIKYYGIEKFDCDALLYIHHGEVRYSPYLIEVTAPKITVMTASRGNEDVRACESA